MSATFTDTFSLKAICNACSNVMITGASDEAASSRMSSDSDFGASSGALPVLYCANASAWENAMPAMITVVTANFFIFLYTNTLIFFLSCIHLHEGAFEVQISRHPREYHWSKIL